VKKKYLPYFYTASGIAFFFLLVLALLPFLVSLTPYKQLIVDELEHRFHAHVTVDSFRFSLLPAPHFNIENLSIHPRDEKFSQHPLMVIKNITGNPSFSDLVFHQKVSTNFELHSLTLFLSQDDQGATNLDSFFFTNENESKTNLSFEIKSLHVEKGSIHFLNNGNTSYSIKNFSLESLNATEFFSRGSGVKIKAGLNNASQQNLGLVGLLSFDQKTNSILLSRGQMQFLNTRLAFNGMLEWGKTPNHFQFHIASSQFNQQTLENISPSLAQLFPQALQWNGNASIDVTLEGTRDDYTVAFASNATESQVYFLPYFSKDAGVPLSIDLQLHLLPGKMNITESSIHLQQNAFSFSEKNGTEENSARTFHLHGEDIDFEPLKPYFPFLAIVDDAKQLTFDFTFNPNAEPLYNGTVSAHTFSLLETQMEKVHFSFFEEAGGIQFTGIEAGFAGGNFSGTGTQSHTFPHAYQFQFIGKNVEASRLKTAPLFFVGSSDVVANLSTSGATKDELLKHFHCDATLLLAEGKSEGLALPQALLREQTLENLGITEKNSLLAQDTENTSVKNLKAEISTSSTSTSFDALQFENDFGNVLLQAKLSEEKIFSGNGVFTLSPKWKNKYTQASQAKETLQSLAQLKIPFQISGDESALTLSADQNLLASLLKGEKGIYDLNIVKEKLKAPPPTLSLPTEEKKSLPEQTADKAKAAPKSQLSLGEKKKSLPPQKAKATTKKQNDSSQKLNDDDLFDIFQVIIGK